MEYGVKFESRDLIPYAPPEYFAAISPLKRIPILQDGDYTLNDSSAICAYLGAAFGDDDESLLPRDPKALGYVLWIEEYADTALFSDISEGVFRPIFINQLMGKAPDMAVVEDTVANRLPKTLGYLEAQLAGKVFFVEDRLTLADISVYAQIANLEHAQHLPDPSQYPHLMGNFGRVKSQASSMSLRASEMLYLETMLAQLHKRA
jgi:glutathione S-transferase